MLPVAIEGEIESQVHLNFCTPFLSLLSARLELFVNRPKVSVQGSGKGGQAMWLCHMHRWSTDILGEMTDSVDRKGFIILDRVTSSAVADDECNVKDSSR